MTRVDKLVEMFDLPLDVAISFDKELTETTVKHFGLMLETANKYEGDLKIKYIIALSGYIRDNSSGVLNQLEGQIAAGQLYGSRKS